MLARASDVALVLLALLLLLPAAHAEQHAAGTFLPSRAAARRLSSGWQACPGTTPLASASRAGYRADPSECFDALVPGTVLRSMIANGSFFPRVRTVDDLYMDDNLKTIPDINSTGKAFFTRVFRVEITEQHLPAETEAADGQLWLHFRGVSYFATVFVDGQAVSPVQSPGATRLAGMFHRWSFDLGSVAALRARRGADSSAPLASVAVLVEPPEFCGRGGADRCGGVKGSCGQGGDHEIAKNAAMMQFTQGWDWAQSTPDRNTGIWDVVDVEVAPDVLMTDAYVRTLNSGYQSPNVSVGAVAALRLLNRGEHAITGDLKCEIRWAHSSSGMAMRESQSKHITIGSMKTMDVQLPTLQLRGIPLWWPHTHGHPALHTTMFTFTRSDAVVAGHVALYTHNITVGIRTVSAEVDPITQGLLFYINHQRIFIEGGNWIATDQLQRYAGDARRYWNEVKMHQQMGLNLIRVWGGGLTERPEFFEACDKLGVLVLQEFWMSGDNNGRWAGSFDWPTDHRVYLDNAEDMVLMLRSHPSLLIWNCGNELYFVDQQKPNTNPNPGNAKTQTALIAKLQAVIARNDVGRFYISSSMSNYSCWDTTCGSAFALAPQDGNYGINPLREYFTRNPGLTFPNKTRMLKVPISFQPEIGSVSSPVVESLQRFMSPTVLAAFPTSEQPCARLCNESHPVWHWHNYEPFEDTMDKVNHLERLGHPKTIQEYSMYAQIAQYFQYQSMYEGFQHHAFEWYSAIVFWKSQSPWPALRGAFYDYYLDTTGGFWGVHAAAAERAHIQLNQLDRTLAVISRHFEDLPNASGVYSYYDMTTGQQLGSTQYCRRPHKILANAVTDLGCKVEWPRAEKGILLLRLRLVATGKVHSTNQYWLAPPSTDPGDGVEEQAWARWRQWKKGAQNVNVSVSAFVQAAHSVSSTKAETVVANITLHVPPTKSGPGALMIRLGLVHLGKTGAVDRRVLPAWFSRNFVSVLPGERVQVSVEFLESAQIESAIGYGVRVDGYRLRDIYKYADSKLALAENSIYVVEIERAHALSCNGAGVGVTTEIVSTANGKLRCSFVGERTRQCAGVPFAAAPTGDLRWRPPAPAQRWQGVRDATSKQPSCIPGNARPKAGATDEDCLYLDIFTPRKPAAASAGYAVMVWIHGGSYSTGTAPNATGIVDWSGDVVWVGVNYRMNVYGFVGSEQLRGRDARHGSTGNYGLQDQRAALAWVRKNIAAFGGNPRLVTIDGCSAGAGSTANHMVNSRSWPYFDQAAGESGVNSQWNTNSLANAEIFFGYLSKRAGGPCGTHVASVVQCMVNLSATKLSALSLLAQIDFNSDNSTDNSTLPFAPVVDGVDVLAPPRELMQRGHIFPGPVLLGTAQDEACSLEGKSYPFDMTRSAFINDTEEEYGINGVSVKRVLELYSGHPATNSSKGFYSKYWWAAIDRGSDFSFHCPTRQAASLLSRRASLGGNRTNLASSRTNHTFLYSFKVPREQWPGLECVPHCSELGTLAMSWQQGPPNALTEAMRGYWTSFVKTGDPNIARHKGSPTWPAYTDQSQASLAFANNADQGVHIQFKYRHDECDYWDTLAGGPCNHLE